MFTPHLVGALVGMILNIFFEYFSVALHHKSFCNAS